MTVKQKVAPKNARNSNAETLFVCDVKAEAKAVYLVGEFNDWNPTTHRMTKKGTGFHKKIQLPPGEYQYKFLVDGEWHNDPKADQVPNVFGTTNSVIRV